MVFKILEMLLIDTLLFLTYYIFKKNSEYLNYIEKFG